MPYFDDDKKNRMFIHQGVYDKYSLPQIISSLQLNQDNAPNIIDQARQQYPILRNNNFAGVVSNYPGTYGDIESWPINETGTTGYLRPKEIPLNTFGVQVFTPNKLKPIDVLADVVSHNLVKTDPQLKSMYGNFIDSLTERQYKKLENDYAYAIKNNMEQRPLYDWAQQSRLPAYFRGYTFNQWPDEFNQQFYTPEQINMLNGVRKYLGLE